VWYFNGAVCILKDGGTTKAAFRPEEADAYVSGLGCRGGSQSGYVGGGSRSW
jgi:hypothetical protein